jgi:glycosyltransferase involved in cell wall biosynthesis
VALRIYWYWPHAHAAPHPLALAMLREGDELVVEALRPSDGARIQAFDAYEVVRDLPNPLEVGATGGLDGLLRRPRIAVGRSRARARQLRGGFDVAHLHLLVHQTDWVDLPRLARRAPLVSHVHDVRPHHSRSPRTVDTALLRGTYRSAGHLVVFHQVLKDELVADFGIDPARVHVIPLPAGEPIGRRTPAEKARPPVLLLFGTLRENKGTAVLLEALRHLGPELEAEVVIAGSCTAAVEAELRATTATMANVRLELGFASHERQNELFGEASWLLLPYLEFHAQSGVLLDAYAHEVPVIASDVGALGATVRADGTGIVVPPADADALADALLQAARTPIDPYAAAAATAVARHSPAAIGPRIRAIYDLATAHPG